MKRPPTWNEVFNALQDLPSAEPELNEWCADCKEYDKEKNSCPRYNRVIRTALEDSWLKWIPVSERLPEEEGLYLATQKSISQEIEFIEVWISYFHPDKEPRWMLEKSNYMCKVVAWMPLPKPYQAGEQE